MVVRITSPQSIQRALNYNEKKVQQGKSECIYAGNYLLTPDKMNFHQKMERMQELISLNERTKKTNTLHISLNFDPAEKNEKEKLSLIAKSYMDKIGFGNQPYLVYQHQDAGHPHIHIVTTTIQADGKRIDTFNVGRNQSEKARKEIETEFGLIKAQDKSRHLTDKINHDSIQKALYGKAETKRMITNVLEKVISQFKFTSLAELNAVLKQYNVVADRGKENGRIFRNSGLLYKLLDKQGKPVGVPVKASLIYSKPTLKNLEKKFAENEIARQPDKKKLKIAIDWALSKSPATLNQFIEALQKEKIQTVLRENKDRLIYGITFIDYRSKAIFNGSDLGKEYSIAGIQQKLKEQEKSVIPVAASEKKLFIEKTNKHISITEKKEEVAASQAKDNLLQQLTDNEKIYNRVPYELKRKKKRKRKNNL